MCVCLVDKLCEGQQQQTHTLRHLRDSVLCWLRIWRMCRGHRVCLSDLLTSTAGDSAILSLSTRPTAGHPAGVSARLSCSKYHRGRRMRGVWGMCSGQGCAGRNESQGVVLSHSLSLFERARVLVWSPVITAIYSPACERCLWTNCTWSWGLLGQYFQIRIGKMLQVQLEPGQLIIILDLFWPLELFAPETFFRHQKILSWIQDFKVKRDCDRKSLSVSCGSDRGGSACILS